MTTLLLVDDDTALTRTLEEALKLQLGASHNLIIRTEATWSGAVEAAKAIPTLNVILVDYHIGTQTGTQLCALLRTLHPGIQALLYTGKATPAVEADALKCKMKVLWKPQRLDAITDAIREALDAQRL